MLATNPLVRLVVEDAARLLGVDVNAAEEAVQAAWRRQVKANHPDRHVGRYGAYHTTLFHQADLARKILAAARTGEVPAGLVVSYRAVTARAENQRRGVTGRVRHVDMLL